MRRWYPIRRALGLPALIVHDPVRGMEHSCARSLAARAARRSGSFADAATIECVRRAFSGLGFPPSEAGVFAVTYPLQLSMSE